MSYLLGQMEATRIIADALIDTAGDMATRTAGGQPSEVLMTTALVVSKIGVAMLRASQEMEARLKEATTGHDATDPGMMMGED